MKEIKEHIEYCIESAEFLLDEFYTMLAFITMIEEAQNECLPKNGKKGIIYQITDEKRKKTDENVTMEQECIQKNDIPNSGSISEEVSENVHRTRYCNEPNYQEINASLH